MRDFHLQAALLTLHLVARSQSRPRIRVMEYATLCFASVVLCGRRAGKYKMTRHPVYTRADAFLEQFIKTEYPDWKM